MADGFMNKFLDMSTNIWDSYKTANETVLVEFRSEIDFLHNELRDMQPHMDSVKAENDNIKLENNNLRLEITNLKREKNSVIQGKETVEGEKGALHTEVLLHRGTITDLEFRNKTMEDKNMSLRERKTNLRRQVRKLKEENKKS